MACKAKQIITAVCISFLRYAPLILCNKKTHMGMMCELKINHVIIILNLSNKNLRRCQLIVNSLSTKWLKVNKSGDKSQQRKFKKCPIYAGLRHFTRGKNNIIAALITRRSLVQIQLPQPHFSSRNAESTQFCVDSAFFLFLRLLTIF